jgi:hypothetical protein
MLVHQILIFFLVLVARLVQSNAFVDEFRHKYCLYSCIDVAHDKNDNVLFGYFFDSCDCREILSNALARLDATTDSLSPTRSPQVQPSQSNQQTPETAVKSQIHVPVTISVSTHTSRHHQDKSTEEDLSQNSLPPCLSETFGKTRAFLAIVRAINQGDQTLTGSDVYSVCTEPWKHICATDFHGTKVMYSLCPPPCLVIAMSFEERKTILDAFLEEKETQHRRLRPSICTELDGALAICHNDPEGQVILKKVCQ